MVSVIGNLVGAFASLFAGLADRWGRANLVVGGLLITGLIIAFGLPNAPNKTVYTVLFAILSFVEGIVLVATPALIRDFSPQVGRGVGDGLLDPRPGARQPRRHRGLQQHPRQPPRLAVPVLRLRHRRPGRLRSSRCSACASSPRRCATS